MRDRDIAATLLKQKSLRRQLRQLPRDLERQEREIGENEDLTTEARAIKLRQVREKERTRQSKLQRELAGTYEKADRLAKQSWNEGGTRAAHNRVQKMLADGISADRIIERALELDDDDLIRALRGEVNYIGNKDGWSDARATINACNKALARLGSDEAAALVEIDKLRVPLDKLAEFAAKSVDGSATPHDRLSLAYALGPDEDDDA